MKRIGFPLTDSALGRSRVRQPARRGPRRDRTPFSSSISVPGAGAHFAPFPGGCGFWSGSSTVDGATFPSFQAANENVTLALPIPASSGTRTGPWKSAPQQN